MAHMNIGEARMIANHGEIHDVEKVSTEQVRLIVKTLERADWRRADIMTALSIANDELAFRIKYGY